MAPLRRSCGSSTCWPPDDPSARLGAVLSRPTPLARLRRGQGRVLLFGPVSRIPDWRGTIAVTGIAAMTVIKGRHDACVGIRAVPVGEAMMACVILDHLLLHRGQVGENQGRIG